MLLDMKPAFFTYQPFMNEYGYIELFFLTRWLVSRR